MKNKIIIFLTGLFFIGCVLSTLNLSFDEKITAMLPDSEPMSKDFKFIADHLPATEIVYIDIESLKADKVMLEKAADELYAQIKDAPFFSEIVYQFSYEAFANLVSLVKKNRAFLLDKNDLAFLEERLLPEEIRNRVMDIKRRLLDPAGVFTADALIHDPLELDTRILSKLEAFKNEAFGIKIEGTRIFSRNSDHLLMMAAPSFPAADTQKSRLMMEFLHKAKDRVKKKYGQDIRIGFSGNHVATLDNSRTIQKDVKRTVIVLSMGILAIGLLFFRRKIYVVLIFLPTLISLSFASAAVSYIYKDVSAIALGCGAVLIGITVDFGIHVLFYIDAGNALSLDQVIKKLTRPILAGAFTTIAAFSCLAFSSMPGQRQMAIYAIIGDGGAALFTIFILRYFIPESRGLKRKPLINLTGICDRMLAARKKHIRLICIVGIGIAAMGVLGIQSFRFEGDITRLNHLQPEAKADMDRFLETWGGSPPSLVLVRAGSPDKALEKNDSLYDLLKSMQNQGIVDRIASLSDIYPSSKKRDENYQRFRQMMSARRIGEVKHLFETTALKSGFKPDAFQPFIDSLDQEVPPFTMDEFDQTVLKKLIDSKMIFAEKEVMILTTLQVTDKGLIPAIVEQIKSNIPDVLFLDKRYFIDTVTTLVASEFKQLFGFSAVSIVLVVMFFFRSFKVTAIIITPVFCAAFVTAGILGLINVPINLISMVYIIFVFGVGVDFSVFLASHELQKTGDEANITAGAVVICALTTISGFICLAFTRHEALFSIGVAGLTGMISSLILSLILVPTLMEKIFPKNEKKVVQ
ncbi:MAG: MMPL family transporter [Desulfobacula sp.]